MHCHCGTNNRAPRWTFTDSCKPEVRPGAREESASPAWLATPAMNARDTTKCINGGLILDWDRHYIGSVTASTQQEKGIITLESNPSVLWTLLPAPHGKGNKCDKNVKFWVLLGFARKNPKKVTIISTRYVKKYKCQCTNQNKRFLFKKTYCISLSMKMYRALGLHNISNFPMYNVLHYK